MKISRRKVLKAIPATMMAGGIWTMANTTARANFVGDWWSDWPDNNRAWYLLLNIQTGNDDLRRQSQASVSFFTGENGIGSVHVPTTELRQQNLLDAAGQSWDNWEWHRVLYPFPSGALLVKDIQQIIIRFASGRPDGWFSSPDKWELQVLEVYYDPYFDPNKWPWPDKDSLDLGQLRRLYRGAGNPLRALSNGWNIDTFRITNNWNEPDNGIQ